MRSGARRHSPLMTMGHTPVYRPGSTRRASASTQESADRLAAVLSCPDDFREELPVVPRRCASAVPVLQRERRFGVAQREASHPWVPGFPPPPLSPFLPGDTGGGSPGGARPGSPDPGLRWARQALRPSTFSRRGAPTLNTAQARRVELRATRAQPRGSGAHEPVSSGRSPERRRRHPSFPWPRRRRLSLTVRPGDREQERALFECFDVMKHSAIEREQTARPKTECSPIGSELNVA